MWNKDFIKQTAKDYDMSVHLVEEIYLKCNEKGLFYEKLEKELEQRRKKGVKK